MEQTERAAAQAVASSPQPDPRPLPAPEAPEGFEDFYRVSYRELVKHAMYMGADLEEARDAAAETQLYMLRIWPVPGYPLRYAREAVVTNFIKAKKRGKLRQRRLPRASSSAATSQPVRAPEDERLATEGRREWVADVLSELTRAQREVMQLIADGLTNEEIAETLNISGAAVRRRLCDARGRLTQLLNPDGEFKQPRRTTARSSREEARWRNTNSDMPPGQPDDNEPRDVLDFIDETVAQDHTDADIEESLSKTLRRAGYGRCPAH